MNDTERQAQPSDDILERLEGWERKAASYFRDGGTKWRLEEAYDLRCAIGEIERLRAVLRRIVEAWDASVLSKPADSRENDPGDLCVYLVADLAELPAVERFVSDIDAAREVLP